jgi:hypothetical protein
MKRMEPVLRPFLVLALSLALSALAPARAASALVGSWHVFSLETVAVVTFLPDGHFMLASHHFDGSDPSGIEWGTFSWYEATSGLQVTTLIDTNGDSGLSSGGGFSPAKLENGKLMIRDHDNSGDWTALSRVPQVPGSLLGSWSWLPGPDSSPSIFSFFADGTYMMAEAGVAEANSQPGVERGRYSWNAATGDLLVTEILVDTNGSIGGSAHVNEPGYLSARIGSDGVLSFTENDAQHSSARFAPVPVPEPATWALWLCGLAACRWVHRQKSAGAR